MKSALLLIFLGIATIYSHPVDNDVDQDRQWEAYKLKFNRTFKREVDEKERKARFVHSLNYINKHNVLYEKGLTGYKMGLNHYTDIMPYDGSISMIKSDLKPAANEILFVRKTNISELPKKFDWREKGVVSVVKLQTFCAACYAFSSAGAIESHMAIKTGKLVPVSVQNIVDCSTTHKNHGCGGGWMTSAFQYVMDNGGIDTEESYPYVDKKQPCQFKNDSIAVKLNNYVRIPADENLILEAVATVGPVSVVVNVIGPDYYYFSEGIYDDPNCTSDPEEYDHAVLIVGYGSENGKDYWIIKNSFGDDWGENGFYKLARNKNYCGVANYASYPVVE